MHKTPKILLLLLIATSFVFTGCPDPLNPDGGLAPGEMRASASVEGNFFATDATVTDLGSFVRVRASQPSSTFNGDIVITLDIPKRTPPYSVTVQSDPAAIIDYCLELSSGTCTNYRVKNGTGSGTISINILTATTIEGTFSGTLQPVGGATGTRTISGGEFKVTF